MRGTLITAACAYLLGFTAWIIITHAGSAQAWIAAGGFVAVGILILSFLSEDESSEDEDEEPGFSVEDRRNDLDFLCVPLHHVMNYSRLAMERGRKSRQMHDLRRTAFDQFVSMAEYWNPTWSELAWILDRSGADTLCFRDLVDERERKNRWPSPKPEWAEALVGEVRNRRAKVWTHTQASEFHNSLYD